MDHKNRQMAETHRQWKNEKQKAAQWVEDKAWVRQERYRLDRQYMEYTTDILEHEIFQSMDGYIQHGRTTCKTHCIQVSYLSYGICQKAGLDAKAAARAGLLHDLFLYDWHTYGKQTGKRFHGLTHPRTALNNANRFFALTDKEKNMILRHMWPLTPIPPASIEGLILVYADKFCSSREILAHIRNTAFQKLGITPV